MNKNSIYHFPERDLAAIELLKVENMLMRIDTSSVTLKRFKLKLSFQWLVVHIKKLKKIKNYQYVKI